MGGFSSRLLTCQKACLSLWAWKLFSKFSSLWPRNRNIHHCSIISDLPRMYQLCHVDVLRMKSRSTAIPPAACTSYTKSDEVIRYLYREWYASKSKFTDAQFFPVEDSALTENKRKVSHHVSTISVIASLQIPNETRATWPTTCSTRSPEKCSLMPSVNPEGICSLREVFCTLWLLMDLRDILVHRWRDS